MKNNWTNFSNFQANARSLCYSFHQVGDRTISTDTFSIVLLTSSHDHRAIVQNLSHEYLVFILWISISLQDTKNYCISSHSSTVALSAHHHGYHFHNGSHAGSRTGATSIMSFQHNHYDSFHARQTVARIFTRDFPQYFAVVSRSRQDKAKVGSETAAISSQTVHHAKVDFRAKWVALISWLVVTPNVISLTNLVFYNFFVCILHN